MCVGGGVRHFGFFLHWVGLEITCPSGADYLVHGDRPGLRVTHPEEIKPAERELAGGGGLGAVGWRNFLFFSCVFKELLFGFSPAPVCLNGSTEVVLN